MIRKPQEKLSENMFECPGSSFKANPRGNIIHSTHYLFSDWPKTYSEFLKSAPKTSSSYRLYNNHAKDAQGSR